MGEKFVGSPIAVGLGRIYIEFGEFKAGHLVSQGLVLVVGGLTVFAIYAGFQESQQIDASNRLLVSVERRVVLVDPGIYEGYAGMYKLEPRFNIEITSSHDRLYGKGTNQVRVELFPASETTFFNEFTDALITFHPDANSHVSEFTLRQRGRVRTGKRVVLAGERER